MDGKVDTGPRTDAPKGARDGNMDTGVVGGDTGVPGADTTDGDAADAPEGGCANGFIACDDGCVDPTSPTSCGTCNNMCGASAPLCTAMGGTFACAASCPAASPTQCGSTCVDTMTDPNHCGKCDGACSTSVANAEATCVSSACTFTCDSGYNPCNGACVNEQTDDNNCGGCGSGHVCSGGAKCRAGTCCVQVALPPSVNVDATQWTTSFKTSPTWNCNATGTTTVDSTQGTVTGDNCGGTATADVTNNVAQSPSGGPNVMVVRLRGLTVSNSHVLKLTGDKPIVFLVAGNVVVDSGGKIDAGATGTTAGPGGSLAANCSVGMGSDATASDMGAGGGGFGTAGGTGKSKNNGNGGAGGGVSSGTDLQPLRGGCGGGKGGNGNRAGGGAGGAFEISASGSVILGTGSSAATLTAAGGGSPATTNNNTGSGGGGSGGGILLVAPNTPMMNGSASVRVHGGAAGSAQGLQSGTAGQDGHSADNNAATGGNAGDGFGENGGNGGLCAGYNCGSASAAGAGGHAANNFVGSGGGGGGGRVQVITGASMSVCN